MYEAAMTQPVVTELDDSTYTIPILKLKLRTTPAGASQEALAKPEGLSLVSQYQKLMTPDRKDKSIVIEFEPGTVRSAVTRELVDLYSLVHNNKGRLYCALNSQDQEFLGASGFTNLPGIRLANRLEVAVGLAHAARKDTP